MLFLKENQSVVIRTPPSQRRKLELLRAKASLDTPDADFDGIYKDRARVLGKELFSLMGIERDDRQKRAEWVFSISLIIFSTTKQR